MAKLNQTSTTSKLGGGSSSSSAAAVAAALSGGHSVLSGGLSAGSSLVEGNDRAHARALHSHGASSSHQNSSTVSSLLSSTRAVEVLGLKSPQKDKIMTVGGRGKPDTGLRYLYVTAHDKGPGPFQAVVPSKPYEAVDLSEYLVEKEASKPAPIEVCTQTDAMLPLPPRQPYRPPATGIDASTQVPHGTRQSLAPFRSSPEDIVLTASGDVVLFDFDRDTAELVNTVVTKTLDQAVTELMHEFSFQTMADRKVQAQEAKDADLARERASLEAAAAAETSKAARLAEARRLAAAQQSVMKKVSASSMAKALVQGGLYSVTERLRRKDYWVDPEAQEVRERVLPALYKAVAFRTEVYAIADALAEAATVDALKLGSSAYEKRLAAEKADRERRYFIRVHVTVPRRAESIDASGEREEGAGAARAATKTVPVGPLPVRKVDTVAAVEDAIRTWLASPPCPACETGGAAGGEAVGHSDAATADAARRVLAMAKGRPLRLFLEGQPLPLTATLLSFPMDKLGHLELKPEGPAVSEEDAEEQVEGEEA